ncbi:MAG: hypothetical protein HQL76_03350 [Magnetococcales bacterium]|nr:hypothetical protein [Magnetococcales bacterium]
MNTDQDMFSTLTPRFLHLRVFRSWIGLVHVLTRMFAATHLAAILGPHLFHHWDFKARLAAFFSISHTSGSCPPLVHAPAEGKLLSCLNGIVQAVVRVNPLVHLDDRTIPHPGDIARHLVTTTRHLWHATLHHVAIFLGAYEQLEIIVRTDCLPKQTIIPAKGKHIIVFGNGPVIDDRRREYIHISDDELFHEHLVIRYSRLYGWRIEKMEGEFGCGFQYATESLNDSIPLTDCAIMRIGHTSILINIEGKNLHS